MSGKSLGLIETVGLAAALEAADAAIKSANVTLAGYEQTRGGGLILVKLTGEIGAVNAAVAAGVAAASRIGQVYASRVIARTAEGVEAWLQAAPGDAAKNISAPAKNDDLNALAGATKRPQSAAPDAGGNASSQVEKEDLNALADATKQPQSAAPDAGGNASSQVEKEDLNALAGATKQPQSAAPDAAGNRSEQAKSVASDLTLSQQQQKEKSPSSEDLAEQSKKGDTGQLKTQQIGASKPATRGKPRKK